MIEEDFKGFEDIKINEEGLWAFKGENTWSRDIVELWKWVQLARKKEKRPPLFDIKFGADDLDD